MRANPNPSRKTTNHVQVNHVVLSTHSGAHQGGNEGKPANERLWNSITAQARARFAKYPSPAAAHWVHQQYILHGGQFKHIKPKR